MYSESDDGPNPIMLCVVCLSYLLLKYITVRTLDPRVAPLRRVHGYF